MEEEGLSNNMEEKIKEHSTIGKAEPEETELPITNNPTELGTPEQVVFELPSGYKISLGSAKFSVDFLCDMSLKLLDVLIAKTNNKTNGGNYLG
jgi:hypothetical protein